MKMNTRKQTENEKWLPSDGKNSNILVKSDAPAQAQHSESEYAEMKSHYLRACTLLDETRAHAQRLADALDKLADRASMANATQHAGQDVPAELWSDIYQRTNEAREALAQWEASNQ